MSIKVLLKIKIQAYYNLRDQIRVNGLCQRKLPNPQINKAKISKENLKTFFASHNGFKRAK